MATYTTNLNLKKPDTTDGALIADINDNMDILDSAAYGRALKTEAIKNITREGTTFTATRCDGTTFTFTQQDNDHYAWSDITGKPSYYDAEAIKNITRSGTTFTATRMNGTTFTFTQQDNDHFAWSDITGKPTFSGGSTTLAWGTQSTIANVAGNAVKVTLPANPNTWRGIQNVLTSTSTSDSLSANMGKVLNDALSKIGGIISNTGAASCASKTETTLTSVSLPAGTYICVAQAEFADNVSALVVGWLANMCMYKNYSNSCKVIFQMVQVITVNSTTTVSLKVQQEDSGSKSCTGRIWAIRLK